MADGWQPFALPAEVLRFTLALIWPKYQSGSLPYIHTGFIAVYLVQPPHLGLSAFAIKEDLSYRDSIF